MQESFHAGVLVNVSAKLRMARFKELAVSRRGHERSVVGAQVVAKADDVDDIADSCAGLFEHREMSLHELVEQCLDICGLGNEVHQEVIHAAQKSSPFEKIAADDNH